MKVQKRLSREYKGRTYYKYVLVLREDDLRDSNINVGDELVSECSNGKIVLRKK